MQSRRHVYEVCPRKESRLKKYLVCAMVLGACQTPTASNQGTTSSKGTTGTGPASPSSRYDVDTFGPLLPPNFPRQCARRFVIECPALSTTIFLAMKKLDHLHFGPLFSGDDACLVP